MRDTLRQLGEDALERSHTHVAWYWHHAEWIGAFSLAVFVACMAAGVFSIANAVAMWWTFRQRRRGRP